MEHESALSDSFVLLKKHFEKMLMRVMNTDLREFELDKGKKIRSKFWNRPGVDFSSDSPQGKYNLQTANMLLGVYEVRKKNM